MKSLVVMHTPANTGYAIAPLETLFYRCLSGLPGSNGSDVHFAYRSGGGDRPNTIPEAVGVTLYDNSIDSSTSMRSITDYVGQHGIELVLFFDAQPTHPIFKQLRKVGVRTIVSYWGAEISSPNRGLRLAAKRAQVALSRSRLDSLIFESIAMANLAVSGRGVPRSMVDVVPLGVDVTKYLPERTDYMLEALGVPAERRVVVYSGHMEERKGVRTLVEAAIELVYKQERRDVQFLLFGNKEGEAKQYEELYRNLDVNDQIRFCGYRSDLHRIFPCCDIGCIPSSGWDSFPRTSLELAACGLPVVASRLGGLPECVLDGQTGMLFTPGDSGDLVRCLELLLSDSDLRGRMGRSGRLRCETDLSLERQYERLQCALRARLHV